jgi:hypothetical protein
MKVLDFAWMPDSKTILVAYGRVATPALLAIIDLEGTVVRQIPFADDLTVELQGLAVRADGQAALIAGNAPSSQSTPTDLYLVDLGNGQTQQITSTPDITEITPSFVDSEHAIVTAGRTEPSTTGPNGWAALIDLNDGTSRRLTSPDEVVTSTTAAWSASTAFYDAFRFGNRGDQAIWQIDISPDAQPQQVLAEDVSFPSVDASGEAIVVTDVATGRLELITRAST